MGIFLRIAIGAIGGIAAVMVKFLAQDANFASHWANIHDPRFDDMVLGYAILGPILVFLGAVVAGFSDETSRIKLLAMAIAAPALITTWAGGVAATSPSLSQAPIQSIGPAGLNLHLAPISDAFAGEAYIRIAQTSAVEKGIGAFFGAGKGQQLFWVIVGSSKDRAVAEQLAQSINQQDPSLNAFVGKRVPNNEYYPVIVGGYVALEEATRLQNAASNLNGVTNQPYLSAFPDRLP